MDLSPPRFAFAKVRKEGRIRVVRNRNRCSAPLPSHEKSYSFTAFRPFFRPPSLPRARSPRCPSSRHCRFSWRLCRYPSLYLWPLLWFRGQFSWRLFRYLCRRLWLHFIWWRLSGFIGPAVSFATTWFRGRSFWRFVCVLCGVFVTSFVFGFRGRFLGIGAVSLPFSLHPN